MNSRPIDYIALAIAIIGTINWGLVGFLDFNLVAFLFGNVMIRRIIYALVGVAGLYLISVFGRIRDMGDI